MELILKLLEKVSWKMDVIEPYSIPHFIIAAGVLSAGFVIAYILKKIKINKEKFLFITGLVLGASEAVKQIFLTYVRGWDYSWSDFPFQLCSIPIYLCLLYPILKESGKKTAEYFLMTFNLIGSLAAFMEPTSSFTRYWLLTIHSIGWHGILFLIGIYLAMENGYKRLKIRQFVPAAGLYLTLALAAVIINAAFFNISGGTANMFFMGPARPNMMILNNIYYKAGWIVETLAMIAATELGGFLAFLPHCIRK